MCNCSSLLYHKSAAAVVPSSRLTAQGDPGSRQRKLQTDPGRHRARAPCDTPLRPWRCQHRKEGGKGRAGQGRAPFEKSLGGGGTSMRLCRRLRWRQPIPLTTIRQDYNWDYRLLTLNACIVLPDQSQGPFDNFIEMLARSTTLAAAVKKLSPTTVALPRRWARWRGLGEGLLAFRKIPFPLSLFARIAYKI